MVKEEKRKAVHQSFGDKYGATKFHHELPKLPLEEVIDHLYLIKEARVVEGFKSKFGKSDFALLLLVSPETGEMATTLCGGMVVVEKIKKAIVDDALPLYGTIVKMISEGGGNEYYDIN